MKIGHILVAWRFAEEMQLLWKYCIFGKNSKPIALLFDENWPILVPWRFLIRDARNVRNMPIFGGIGKPIALLFDAQNWQ